MNQQEVQNQYTDDILRLIKNVYHTILYVNLSDATYHCVQTNQMRVERFLRACRTFDDFVDNASVLGMLHVDDMVPYEHFLDRRELQQHFQDGAECLRLTYRRAKPDQYRWQMMEITPASAYADDNQVVLICVRDIDDERQKELDKEAKLSLKEKQLVGEKCILVVDDNEIQRSTMCYFLEQNYKTVAAENGKVALDYLRAHSTEISVILLDVNMPVMNGYEFLEEFKKDDILNMIPVLMLTSDDSKQEEAKCLNAGASDFVAKPFQPQVLLTRINRAIALHENTVMFNVLKMDSLTDCYTHDYFLHMADQLLAKYPEEDFDIVCTHVVNLSNINEQYGTRQGQEVLRYVARSHADDDLERSVFGRLDNSTFVQMLPHSEDSYNNLSQLETDVLHEYKQVKSGLPPFVQKYGIYEHVDRSVPVSVMCDRAMMALEKNKNAYKQIVNLYDDSIRHYALKNQYILESMEEAITQRQFQVWYQPKHDIHTGKIVGAEALVRWIHPRYGFMSPADFIPIFEDNGFVAYVDCYVWDESCAAMRRWQDAGLKHIPVSINISRKDFLYFNDREIKDILHQFIDNHHLKVEDLHIEVTESAYIDNPEIVIKKVNEMHNDGFVVELDDFGTGYSSLSMFGHMNIDIVKLDMSFIRQEQTERNDRMMRYIIDMCKSMGLAVLSEGVETEEHRQRLIDMGCDYVQGYYYSKPLPEPEFIEYLKKHS